MAERGGGESDIWIYLPYADELGQGMQRYASQMVMALQRSGLRFRLIIGELHGSPLWLREIPYHVAIGPQLATWLPRPLMPLLRLAWLHIVFPLRVRTARNGVLLALAHELPSIPFMRQVAVAHDITDLKAFAERMGFATRVRNALWKRGLRRSEQIVAISQATRRDVIEVFGLNPERVQVVYEGADPALFKPKPEPSAKAAGEFLLYAGTLDPHKNVAFLLDVYTRLRERIGGIELKLVGRHDPHRVQALLKELPPKLRNEVHFVGFVTDEALAELMRQCTAFVFPSRNEGFGLAPVEAMACGAPVLAAAAGSLPEVVGSGGLLLSPDDPDLWVAELERVLLDRAYRAELASRALIRGRSFSWAEAAEAYKRILVPDTRITSPAHRLT